ncbi:hypothetical protein AAU61_06680 [Desulfocarbo indianensis]|nr:hypothetical protein AAU61_06680 [Desulfocarbo indianensis]
MQDAINQSLDLRGSDSPLVVLKALSALRELNSRQWLEVKLSSAARARDLERIAQAMGGQSVMAKASAGFFRLLLCRALSSPQPPQADHSL